MPENLTINSRLSIPASAIEWTAIRSSGAGGQKVNKVATAIHLRLNLEQCPMSDALRQSLLQKLSPHLNKDGELIIKANRYRTQKMNLNDARNRLAEMLRAALKIDKIRHKTRPGKAAVQRRLDNKSRRSGVKRNRRKPLSDSDL